MNQVWNTSRFGRLVRAHLAQSRRTYLWFAGVVAIVDVILLVLIFGLELGDKASYFFAFQFSAQVMWFWAGAYTIGVIFATRYFEGLSNPGATLVTLMRPASVFEKWLSAFLVVGIAFPIAFTAVYAVLHWPFVLAAQALYAVPPDSYRSAPDFTFYLPFTASGDSPTSSHNSLVSQMIGWLVLSSLQAFCLSCTIYFKKAAVLKMSLVAFVVLLLTFVLAVSVNLNFRHVTTFWMLEPGSGLQFALWESILTQLVLFGVPLMLWCVVFLNLQEREVS